MIVAELKGGLGNQMFQYASAFGIAKGTDQKLFINTEWFHANKNIDTPREYELGCFNISANTIDRSKLTTDGIGGISALFKHRVRILTEKGFNYDEEVLKARDVLLDGYWQSPKYFEKYRDDILYEFRFKDKVVESTSEFASKISSSNSVSLHVRRGDYVSNKQANTVHGTMAEDYYRSSLNHLKNKEKDLSVFVISDDIDWCKANLKIDAPTTFIEGNTRGCMDMYLMSLCKHNIIANSSFSWWGAWLNNNPNKTVIAPKRWFAGADHDTSDLIPEEWIRI